MLFTRFIFLFILMASCQGQKTIEKTLERYNSGSIPYIQVDELARDDKTLRLDAREKEEFLVSHLPGATWVGYKDFDIETVLDYVPDKDTEIVVYCSVGVRSERIGEDLKEAGFTNVKNLYGGIFGWKNAGYPVMDPEGNPTQKVHAFSKSWDHLLKAGEKVYKR
ncbi:rhodanese-like domain-containing protein [Zeaxanthinibacter enoshimensis]|uniref:Rhodanese-related sulfurtransferase n=1 Tax=Zeaxanthinibacter enoshimensis TaxID=392009 RepID=A0A4R6TSY7_9FLAO|nr:rhodanese-like domain-containing protein [Zeaxanthinibacter enoshimensis]TDQ33303.1 rhodanese-related sulfurtransferase [Zeaxanthinibacter enoshimensis]